MVAKKKSRIFFITPIEDYLGKNQPVLFLNKFNKEPSLKLLQKLDYQFIPHFKIDKNQQQKNFNFVLDLSNTLIIELTDALNGIHGTSYSNRYWKILIGPWVYWFISILLNRWITIQEIVKKNNINKAIILNVPRENLVPTDFLDFAFINRSTDEWDHAIYGIILKDWTNIVCEIKNYDKEKFNQKLNIFSVTKSYKKNIKHFLVKAASIYSLFSRKTDGVLFESSLGFKELVKLQFSLGQFPILRITPPTPKTPANFNYRKNLLSSNKAKSPFENFVRILVSEQIPTCYLEGYKELRHYAKKLNWPTNPKFIFTSNAFDGDEIFKIWTAEKTEKNSCYIIGQHGGYYGTGKFSFSENHEVSTCDRFLTWGWTDQNSKHFPSFMFKEVKKVKHNPKGNLLLTDRQLISNILPWNEQKSYETSYNNQLKFMSMLPLNIQRKIVIRCPSYHLMQSETEKIKMYKKFPSLNIDKGTISMENQINRSRLVVHNYNGTPILETLFYNIPTLIYFNSDNSIYHSLRSSAKPYFDKLESVGIFHTSLVSLSNKVTEVWDDVNKWWHHPVTQKERYAFCYRYANNVKDRTKMLKKALTYPL